MKYKTTMQLHRRPLKLRNYWNKRRSLRIMDGLLVYKKVYLSRMYRPELSQFSTRTGIFCSANTLFVSPGSVSPFIEQWHMTRINQAILWHWLLLRNIPKKFIPTVVCEKPKANSCLRGSFTWAHGEKRFSLPIQPFFFSPVMEILEIALSSSKNSGIHICWGAGTISLRTWGVTLYSSVRTWVGSKVISCLSDSATTSGMNFVFL